MSHQSQLPIFYQIKRILKIDKEILLAHFIIKSIKKLNNNFYLIEILNSKV